MTYRNDNTSMLKVSQVAPLLHVHVNTLRRWSDKGLLRTYRIGPRGDRRYKREDIINLKLEESGIR